MSAHWIVIEGDNGVGKDTLADLLAGSGWVFLNCHPQAVAAAQAARGCAGRDRHDAFMRLNDVCAELALAHRRPCLLVRYWPSTVTAALADGRVAWGDFLALVGEAARHPQPALFLNLLCAQPERVRRIRARGPVGGRFDDLAETRAECYRRGALGIAARVESWVDLDTTSLSPGQVHCRTLEILNRRGLLP